MYATLIFGCALAFALTATAQDSVSIYFDSTRRQSDTLDFGYVMAGDSVIRQLFIENASSQEVQIPQGIRPYIAVDPVLPFSENDPDEFPLEALFPFRVGPYQTRAYPLRYTATLFAQHPAGLHQVALTVSVRRSDDTASIAAKRRFILRATKSFRPIWSDQQFVEFDSVYVGSPFDRVHMITMRNVTRQLVPAQILLQGDQPSLDAFSIDADATSVFASEEVKQYRVQFRPPAAGRYALDVLFVHPSPLRNGGPDSTALQLRGVGVVQKLQCRLALSPNVVINGDTIVVRNRAVNKSDTIALVFQNTGNIPIGAIETQLDTHGSLSDITILRGFRITEVLQPQMLDTVVAVVHPLRPGVSSATIRLLTDLLRRPIYGAPIDAAQFRFVLQVESTTQRLVSLQSAVDFGTHAALGACSENTTDIVRLENRSDEPVTLTSVTLPTPFTTSVQLPLVVAPGAVQTIPVSVAPLDHAADVQGFMTIESSDTAYSPLRVGLRIRFIPAPTPSVYAPQLEYVPGSTALLPLRWTGDSATLYSAGMLELVLEPTVAEIVGVQTTNTATEGASVTLDNNGNGRYRIRFQSVQRFIARDTLIMLVLRTYLGQQPQSTISLPQFRVGTLKCPDVVAGNTAEGVLAVEPFCGMGYKFPVVFPALVLSDAVSVSDGMIAIECWSDSERVARLDCVATDGRIAAQYQLQLRAGRQTIVIPTELARGVYGVRLRDESIHSQASRVVVVR